MKKRNKKKNGYRKSDNQKVYNWLWIASGAALGLATGGIGIAALGGAVGVPGVVAGAGAGKLIAAITEGWID